MNDTCCRWNGTIIFKGLFSPLKKFVTLIITLKLQINVIFKRRTTTIRIYLNRVVNHQVHRNLWINKFCLSSIRYDCITHGCQINNNRNSGKVLKNNTTWFKRNFRIYRNIRKFQDTINVRFCNINTVLFS